MFNEVDEENVIFNPQCKKFQRGAFSLAYEQI